MERLYKLTPNPKVPDPFAHKWDIHVGFIISAKSSTAARKMAAFRSGDNVWRDKDIITVTVIGTSCTIPKVQIIMEDCKRG